VVVVVDGVVVVDVRRGQKVVVVIVRNVGEPDVQSV